MSQRDTSPPLTMWLAVPQERDTPPGAQKARFRGTPRQHLSERGLEKPTPKEKTLEIPIHIPLATHERERQMVRQASVSALETALYAELLGRGSRIAWQGSQEGASGENLMALAP